MRLHRLFNVLVVMCGAPLLGCESDDGQRRDELGDMPDAGATADAVIGEGDPCFCDVQVCCDRESEPAHVVEGFVCCWSTTCP
jgi:hypothetical protein